MTPDLIVLSEGLYHIAVYKPHDMSTVGGRGVVRPTLLDLVRKKFGRNVFPVHRLDRVTSGITIFARSIFAKHAMENAFKKRLVKKIYYAICEGQASFKKTVVNSPLRKISPPSKRTGPMAKQIIDAQGEKAITNLRFLEQLDPDHCLIEANPISGRMHQIRAHLAMLGLPIVGDKLYGASSSCGLHTIALCAVAISLPLPKGKLLNLDAKHLFDIGRYIAK